MIVVYRGGRLRADDSFPDPFFSSSEYLIITHAGVRLLEEIQMKKTRHAILVALATSFTLPTIAEEQSPIIVTATRTAQTVDESLASVTVITKEQIEQQQANDLNDLLSGIAGIDMINSGGFGKDSSLYMRGTNTGHVLVMIDGVQIGSATLGQVAYQDIPVDLIDRIEIVRGARASLYGSEAIGGVIQIFTRKPTNETSLNFTSTFGSNNMKKNTAGISGSLNKTSYSIQASTFSTDGFNARQNNNPDNDGYEQTSANIFVKHKFSNTNNIEATFINTDSVNEYDGSTTTSDYYSEGLQQAVGIKGTFSAATNWQVILKANQGKDYTDSFKDDIKSSIFNTEREIFIWQNDISIGKNNLLTLGLENKNTSVNGTSTYTKSSRDNSAIFIQNNWSKNSNDLLFSIRRDDNESFGEHTTGNLTWSHNIYSDTRLILSAGTAFKAPSFNDLYYPLDAWGNVGNPNILPETSNNIEISVKKKNIQLNFYKTEITNLISWEEYVAFSYSPVNIGKSIISGIEFLTQLNLNGWDTQVNLSYTDPIDVSTGKVLENRSRESLRIDTDKKFSNYSLGATVKYQGTRYTSSAELNDYTLVDLRANYKINKNWDVKGKITNALDEEYTVNDGYNTPNRRIFVSIHYQGF